MAPRIIIYYYHYYYYYINNDNKEVCTPGPHGPHGPHVSILPSCGGDMWHHRSKVLGLSEGAWQTFKDGDGEP